MTGPEWGSELLTRQFNSVQESEVVASSLLDALGWAHEAAHTMREKRVSIQWGESCLGRWHLTILGALRGKCHARTGEREPGKALLEEVISDLGLIIEMLYFDKEGRERPCQQNEQRSRGQGKAKTYICAERTAVQPSRGNRKGWGCREDRTQSWMILILITHWKV